MGVIVKAIEGMAEACRVLDFPVVSGNVSLYNETDGVGIPPTPVVGGIGLIENLDHIATLKGAQAGHLLLLVGETKGHLGASAYARVILGLDGAQAGSAPLVDLEIEKRNADFVRALIGKGLAHAVHDISEGGIACAAAEMALASGCGVTIDMAILDRLMDFPNPSTWSNTVFGEDQARYLVAVSEDVFERMKLGADGDFPPQGIIGRFSGDKVRFVHDRETDVFFEVPLATLRAAHEGWLPNYMNGQG